MWKLNIIPQSSMKALCTSSEMNILSLQEFWWLELWWLVQNNWFACRLTRIIEEQIREATIGQKWKGLISHGLIQWAITWWQSGAMRNQWSAVVGCGNRGERLWSVCGWSARVLQIVRIEWCWMGRGLTLCLSPYTDHENKEALSVRQMGDIILGDVWIIKKKVAFAKAS